MDDVAKFPKACELDDYAEYKRLRKLHRDQRSKAVTASPDMKMVLPIPTKVAPVIAPLSHGALGAKSLARASPAASRGTTTTGTPRKSSPVPSKTALAGSSSFNFGEDTFWTQKSPANLAIPANVSPVRRTETSNSNLPRVSPSASQDADSNVSTPGSHQSDIKEVAPWTDFDLTHLITPVGASTRRSTTRSDIAPDKINTPTPMSRKETRGRSGSRYDAPLRLSPSGQSLTPGKTLGRKESRKESRKSIFVGFRNPMTKLFDGTDDEPSSMAEYFSLKRLRATSVSPKRTTTASRRRGRASSTGDAPYPSSLIPLGKLEPNPAVFQRRSAISFAHGYVTSPTVSEVHSNADLESPHHSLDDLSATQPSVR